MGSLTDLYSNNISLILGALRAHGTLARNELADLTGLTRTTVSRAVSELAEKGVVREVEYGEASPRGGRKPIRLKLNDDVFGMIGLDLRREKVSGCLVHLGGALEAELSCPIAANASRRAILDLMHGVVDQLRSAATVPVMGIGIGTIGHVDPTTGVIRPQAFDSMHGVNLVEVLAAQHGLPVSVRTGASAAAVGEYYVRKQRDATLQSLAFVMIDYGGIGLGLISDDVLWANRSGLGEFGHIVIDYNGRPCECGRRGCLATYASGRATLKRLAELSGDCTPGVGMAQLAHMAEEGDVNAQRALAEAGFYLGYGVTDIDCIVHPVFIVLGSSHPHLSEWYMKGLLKQIEEASTSIFGDDLSERVVLAEKGSYAIAYGGATLQIRKFYESPVSILEQLPDATELTTLLR